MLQTKTQANTTETYKFLEEYKKLQPVCEA